MGRATLKILTERVGDGGAKQGTSVRRLQALLYLGGYLKASSRSAAADGKWDDKCRAALATVLHLPAGAKDVSVEPNDPRLYDMLFESPATIPLSPGQQGSRPFLALQRFFKFEPVTPFRYPKGMLVWGIDGVPNLAVVTEVYSDNRPWFLPIKAVLNCATYANLMMSVWRQGNCHAAPYQAGVGESGSPAFPQVRYGYPRLNGGKPIRGGTAVLLEIEKPGPDGLYCLQSADGGSTSSVGHIALLYKSRVYECNYGGGTIQEGYDGNVQDHPIHDWMQSRAALGCYVAGPSTP